MTLREEYGLDAPIVPFTRDFPHADIYELISSDLLHQAIKGTFKDHLVAWVGEYLEAAYETSQANRIMDEIDLRWAPPSFVNPSLNWLLRIGWQRFLHFRDCVALSKVAASSSGLATTLKHWWRYVTVHLFGSLASHWTWTHEVLLLDLFTCDSWPCSSRCSKVPISFPRLLLYCKTQRFWQFYPSIAWQCPSSIPYLPWDIPSIRSPQWVFLATPALLSTLSPQYSGIWCPKWALFINNRITTHHSS